MGICPRCEEPRLGAFRFCRRCGLDFDAPAAPPRGPDEAAPTIAAWVPPAGDGPEGSSLGRRSRRLSLARLAVVGVLGLVGVGAMADAVGRPAAALAPSVAGAPTSPVGATSEPPTVAPPTPTERPTAAAFAPTGPTQTATVIRVTDGDTIVVAMAGAESRVRYIGMDTPEPNATDPLVRAMADQATAANAALVEGREVLLERDVSETDRFDRLLRNVWVPSADGDLVMVGLELVRQGFAQVSTYPPDVRYVDLLLEIQDEARTREVGLWASTPPPAAEPTALVFLVDTLTLVGTSERTRFEGIAGAYTWSALALVGERATVRWDVRAGDADCRVAWRLEPIAGDVIKSTIRVDAGGRERDNRRYDIGFQDAAFSVTSTCPTWVMTMQGTATTTGGGDCDDSYPGVCIPPYPPDLDCGDIPERDFAVVGSDPHGFDREGDGLGCES